MIGFVLIAVFSAVAWVAAPKGDTQTVWRSSLILSAWYVSFDSVIMCGQWLGLVS